MNSTVKIRVSNLSKNFGDIPILRGVNLDIKTSRSLVILGSSGVGKSVLIKIMIGLMKPDSGSIFFDGQRISYPANPELLKKCGFLFQNSALFDSLTIIDNILFLANQLDCNLSIAQKEEMAASKLEMVGLDSSILYLYPDELSGGMRKRVALARAICTEPEVIFFDEPTTGLDPINTRHISELIIKIKNSLNNTVIIITHDMQSTRLIADDVALLHDGQIAWYGTKDEMASSDSLLLNNFINGF